MNKFIITEEEKSRILSLHKKEIIKENKIILNEVDLKQIQQLLMQRLGPNALGPKKDDGRLGPYTLNAIYSALTQTQGQPQAQPGTQPQPGTGVQPQAGAGAQPQAQPGTQPQAQKFVLKPNMIGKGIYQDEAQGRTYTVVTITDMKCDLVEVTFTNKAGRTVYGYYQPSVQGQDNEISFRRFGEGVKSTNPCEEKNQLVNLGTLQFS